MAKGESRADQVNVNWGEEELTILAEPENSISDISRFQFSTILLEYLTTSIK